MRLFYCPWLTAFIILSLIFAASLFIGCNESIAYPRPHVFYPIVRNNSGTFPLWWCPTVEKFLKLPCDCPERVAEEALHKYKLERTAP